MKLSPLLLVEDDQDLAYVTKDALEDAGYEIVLAHTIEQAETALFEASFCMIILDINLPDDTGFSFCERIRKLYDLPILFISARTSMDDKLTALSLGGDDILAKPYSLEELTARVHAHIRRNYQLIPHMKCQSGPFEMDDQRKMVWKHQEQIALSEKEYDILSYLMRHSGHCISKEILFAEIWGQSSEAQDNTVSVHIRWLREKLEENPSHPTYLKTVWGRGYMWEESE